MKNTISRRSFVKTAATAAAAVLAWEPVVSFGQTVTQARPRRLDLGGMWQVSQAGKDNWIPASVPGCIHTDLLAAGQIPDPFYRDNEKSVQWISDTDWRYRRSFDVPAEVLKNDRVLLRCEGLDTLAVIKINGHEVGRADNMFRLWEFDVKSKLQTGENSIEVLFKSPSAYIKQHDSEQTPQKWVKGRAWLRKEPCSYGWDWGPVLASSGIWKNISLETFNEGRIADVLVRQNHDGGKVILAATVTTETVGTGAGAFKAIVTVRHNGKSVAAQTVEFADGKGEGSIEIQHPKLWWPAGMGGQPLYDVTIELLGADGGTIDSTVKRIGLRTLKAVLPQGDSPLHFEVNGVPFFAKGANWIPADSFPHRVTTEISRRFVADAAAVNMNVLRFWGGGYYEDDAL
ncbi:MAG TPA: twin-arginine translocation signal domain-containing protein, partial [Candidatus Acidoferrum sp.]|nr:twin-arginine translocation signal domain-containing protein [Candidatus Acidoferrum sp.]